MNNPNNQTAPLCEYRTPEGKECTRTVRGPEPYCSLHYGCNRKMDEEIPKNPQFESAIASVIEAKDGDWSGFVFPAGIKLPKEIDFPVDARWSRLSSFEQEGVVFKASVSFVDAIFSGRLVLRGVVFEDSVTFDRCTFGGPVDVLYVQCRKSASFYRADFAARVILRVNFRRSANFNEAVFREGVIFSGWRNVTIQISGTMAAMALGTATISTGREPTIGERIRSALNAAHAWIQITVKRAKQSALSGAKTARDRFRGLLRRFAKTDPNAKVFRMFDEEGQLQGVVFLKPDQTVFSEVDLSRVYFRGTNLRGVRFLGVNWWQPTLGRNGMYDELFIRLSKDGPFRYQSLPVLEETCRNARVSLEENRSFSVASDFYITEMEAIRTRLPFLRRHIFSVPALYQFVSNYGTSVGIALRILFELYLLHFGASALLDSINTSVFSLHHVSEVSLRSLKVLLLQSPESAAAPPLIAQAWCDLGLRIAGPAQVAMLVLAFRARIKRH